MPGTHNRKPRAREMNVEQALNAADESESAGLCGIYPTAAQVLAAEVRALREMIAYLNDMHNENNETCF